MAEPNLQGGNHHTRGRIPTHVNAPTLLPPRLDRARSPPNDRHGETHVSRRVLQEDGRPPRVANRWARDPQDTRAHVGADAPRIDLPRLVQFFKGGSSYAASRQPGNALGLPWAKEYSATTVSPRRLKEVMHYLETQHRHHPGEAIGDPIPRLKPGLGGHCP